METTQKKFVNLSKSASKNSRPLKEVLAALQRDADTKNKFRKNLNLN